MPRENDAYVYDPLDRQTYEVIAYNAVGRGSEINTLPAYKLTHSTGQSGWSVGLMQWDMGQHGRQQVVPELVSGYQQWAPENSRFTEAEVQSLTTRLQTPGQHGNVLTAVEQDRINGFLRSDSGREFVNGLDRQQIAYKWDNVGQPLSEIRWLQDLRQTDPGEAAEIVAMASKRFNQGETRGRELIHHLEQNQMTSNALSDWIDTVSARAPANRAALLTGRDNALTAVRLVNDLELGDGRLSRAWREELHTNGNVGLTQRFSTDPDVQLFDAMLRNPTSGKRILSTMDDASPAQPTVITGANDSARLEMSRVELNRQGSLTIRSPDGVSFEATPEGWNRNGVAMQNVANPVRANADHLDHFDRGRPPQMPQMNRQEGDGAEPARGAPQPALPQMQGPPGRGNPNHNGPERRDQDHDGPPQPPRHGAQLMTDPDHVANPSLRQAALAMDRAGFDAEGRLTPEQRERALAGVTAGVLADTRTNMSRIDRVDASTITEPQTGLPKYLIAGQGDPTSEHYRRVAVDVGQAVNTPVEQSSDIAKTAVQTREQMQVQQLAQAQTMQQDGQGGPSMRMGARSLGGDAG